SVFLYRRLFAVYSNGILENPASPLAFFTLFSLSLLAIQRGYDRFIPEALITGGTLIIFSLALSGAALRTFYFLVILLLFASLFCRRRQVILLAGSYLAGMLLCSLLLPGSLPLAEIILGPGVFNLLAGMIIGIALWYREKVEQIRRTRLTESEERYRIISEMMSDYAYALRVLPDNTFQMEWVTDSFTPITGMKMTGPGIPTTQAIVQQGGHPEDALRAWEDLQKTARGEETSGEYRILRHDGSVRWLYIHRRPVRDASERVTRIYGMVKDITPRRQAEAQNLELALKQERLNFIGRFVTATSQEFRTSLASIEVSRYIIQRKMSANDLPRVQHHLHQIRDYVVRLTQQIDNFHTVTALTGLKTEPRQVNQELLHVLSGYHDKAHSEQVDFVFAPDDRLPPVSLNPMEFSTAVKALLDNAFNNTPAGGRITVSTGQQEHYAIVRVQDTGRGISAEHLPYIFDFFYRADPARALQTGGIGLGLSLVQMIMQAHGGTVQVETQPGGGSTFTLLFPLPPAPAAGD
nr:ATP-binding protein [Anaerolineae bacterium]